MSEVPESSSGTALEHGAVGQTQASRSRGFSRRGAIGLGLAGAVAAGGVATVGWAAPRTGDAEQPVDVGGVVPFLGAHQAGIATVVQDRMHLVAFDLTTTDKAAVARMLRRWSAAAEAMTGGDQVGQEGAFPAVAAAPPEDTGEAVGLPASRLTLTLGLGPGFFAPGGKDAFGLASRRPAGLIDLPHFAGDQLDPNRSGGDIIVQACADDPQVAVHAIRNLARIGFGVVAVRWSQLGFGKTASTTPAEMTPRNLFGFKDGTANIAGDDAAALRANVWVDAAADGAPDWMDGGSYLVARRIAMRIETWDRSSLAEQEQIIGRTKNIGAPLGRDGERDEILLSSLPRDSHVAIAHPDNNGGVRLLRRGYSYVDGSDGLGRLDAGLFFIAFCRDPATQYVPMQSRLARLDALSEYLLHTGSGLYAVPRGVQQGEYWAQSLLEG